MMGGVLLESKTCPSLGFGWALQMSKSATQLLYYSTLFTFNRSIFEYNELVTMICEIVEC